MFFILIQSNPIQTHNTWSMKIRNISSCKVQHCVEKNNNVRHIVHMENVTVANKTQGSWVIGRHHPGPQVFRDLCHFEISWNNELQRRRSFKQMSQNENLILDYIVIKRSRSLCVCHLKLGHNFQTKPYSETDCH